MNKQQATTMIENYKSQIKWYKYGQRILKFLIIIEVIGFVFLLSN